MTNYFFRLIPINGDRKQYPEQRIMVASSQKLHVIYNRVKQLNPGYDVFVLNGAMESKDKNLRCIEPFKKGKPK